jgi:hypothetical protein
MKRLGVGRDPNERQKAIVKRMIALRQSDKKSYQSALNKFTITEIAKKPSTTCLTERKAVHNFVH